MLIPSVRSAPPPPVRTVPSRSDQQRQRTSPAEKSTPARYEPGTSLRSNSAVEVSENLPVGDSANTEANIELALRGQVQPHLPPWLWTALRHPEAPAPNDLQHSAWLRRKGLGPHACQTRSGEVQPQLEPVVGVACGPPSVRR